MQTSREKVEFKATSNEAAGIFKYKMPLFEIRKLEGFAFFYC